MGVTLKLSAAAAAVIALSASAVLTPDQNRDIVLAAWQAVADHFYDPQYRGLDWNSIRTDVIRGAHTAQTSKDVERIIYDLFLRLNNSHSGLSTPAERAARAAMVPLILDRVDDRLFIAYVQPSDRQYGIQYGDEVLGIDGVQPAKIWLPVKRFHRSVEDNPLYGPSGSTADISTRRHGGHIQFAVARVRHGYRAEDAIESKVLEDGILYIRLNALGGADLPAERLRALFREAAKHRGTILDLRDCPGGDLKASAVLASILLGPGKDYYSVVPRQGKVPAKVYCRKPPAVEDIELDVEAGTAVLIRTYAEDVQYRGPLAVLANTRTASEPENLVAAMKIHKRAKSFGSRTQGATHGWSLAVPLPHQFGAVAIPYTRTLMADGKEYEGSGIDADVKVSNTVADYIAGRDSAVRAAIRYLRTSR